MASATRCDICGAYEAGTALKLSFRGFPGCGLRDEYDICDGCKAAILKLIKSRRGNPNG